ncbi:ribosome modulation factor [Hahella sp. CCB-MM4]|uniref:ribosome modulation factor n=1 Tax=Hahella TaxID=158481 RepID=UPI000475EF8C|nr:MULTISPECIES: ribosome modulation factor [Hahella]OZG72077.1 ribosome modulation factor [Hahella sp. CCB-MM4]
MRRQKRDMFERAYLKGYRAGISGRSKDLCPTGNPQMRQEWINGWRDGRTDHWDGYVGVSGLHKLPGIAS